MYTHQKFEASRGGVMLPTQQPPIAYAVHAATFLVCVLFAGFSFGWAVVV